MWQCNEIFKGVDLWEAHSVGYGLHVGFKWILTLLKFIRNKLQYSLGSNYTHGSMYITGTKPLLFTTYHLYNTYIRFDSMIPSRAIYCCIFCDATSALKVQVSVSSSVCYLFSSPAKIMLLVNYFTTSTKGGWILNITKNRNSLVPTSWFLTNYVFWFSGFAKIRTTHGHGTWGKELYLR